MDWDIILKAMIAMAGTAVVLGAMLAIASRKLAVHIDPKIETVYAVLPQSNCGACGYIGCEQAAEAVVGEQAGVGVCVAGGQEVANRVAHVLGKDTVEVGVPKVAGLNCGGGCKLSKLRYEYHGVPTCSAAHALSGGPLACDYGCTGFGDCVRACPFDAMRMGSDQLPEILIDKCTGCGVCVSTCPLGEGGLLSLVDEGSPIVVACSSHAGPKATRQVCSHGCIACKACEKVCEPDAIVVVDSLAVVDYDKCTGCGACVEKCPTKCILFTRWGQPGGFPEVAEAAPAARNS